MNSEEEARMLVGDEDQDYIVKIAINLDIYKNIYVLADWECSYPLDLIGRVSGNEYLNTINRFKAVFTAIAPYKTCWNIFCCCTSNSMAISSLNELLEKENQMLYHTAGFHWRLGNARKANPQYVLILEYHSSTTWFVPA